MRGSLLVAALVLVALVVGTNGAAPGAAAACAKTKVVKGKRVCVKRRPAPKPPPKPKLAPSKRGHYSGATAQNAAISFDVALVSGKVVLRGIALPELDEPCDPGGTDIAFSLSFPTTTLRPDSKGRVHTSLSFDRTGGGRGTFVLDATVTAGGKASGTLSDVESLNLNGDTLSCATGTLAWSAGTGRAAVALAPRPQPGRYHGTTSQGASIDFTVTTAGEILFAQGVSFVEIDETCSPGQLPVALYNVSFAGTSMLVDGHGRMHFVYQVPASTLDPTSRTFTIDATFDASGRAVGTVTDHDVFEADTGFLTCDSGQVTWTATRQ